MLRRVPTLLSTPRSGIGWSAARLVDGEGAVETGAVTMMGPPALLPCLFGVPKPLPGYIEQPVWPGAPLPAPSLCLFLVARPGSPLALPRTLCALNTVLLLHVASPVDEVNHQAQKRTL